MSKLEIRPARGPGLPLSLLVLVWVFCAGCPTPQDQARSRARQVFDEKIEESTDFADFAFSLLAGADDPSARRLIVAALASEEIGRVRRALGVLGDAPPPEAREALQRIFASRSGALKLQAAIALGHLADEAALEWLREEAVAGGAELSAAALKLLASTGERGPVEEVLRRRMGHDQLGVRNEAYVALGEIGESWATNLLLEGLDREFGEERAQAITSLGRIGVPELASGIEKLIGYKGLVLPSIEALGRLGNPFSISVVEPLGRHEQPVVRAYAGIALWRLGRQEAAREVIDPLVTAEDPLVRHRLAEQLAGVDDPYARDHLVTLAGDPDAGVRAAALRSLVDRSWPGLEALLLEKAGDPDYRVSTVALSGLARSGGPAASVRIEPLLESENPYVAITAARAILAIAGRNPAAAAS